MSPKRIAKCWTVLDIRWFKWSSVFLLSCRPSCRIKGWTMISHGNNWRSDWIQLDGMSLDHSIRPKYYLADGGAVLQPSLGDSMIWTWSCLSKNKSFAQCALTVKPSHTSKSFTLRLHGSNYSNRYETGSKLITVRWPWSFLWLHPIFRRHRRHGVEANAIGY